MDAEQRKEFVDSIKEMGAEMEREAKAMAALTKRTQQLRDADNAFMIQKAKTRQEIEKARLIAEDETKSAQERLDNLKKALELEAETTDKEIKLAKLSNSNERPFFLWHLFFQEVFGFEFRLPSTTEMKTFFQWIDPLHLSSDHNAADL